MRKMKFRSKSKTILIIAALIIILYAAGNIISICAYSGIDEKCEVDAAIVLGAATYNGEVSPVYRERLNHSIVLYEQGYIKKVIVTGGRGAKNEQSDAYAAKQYMIRQGIPEDDILLEEESSITQENLENSKALMDENGYHEAIIVSDPLHMKRAMLLAEDTGMKAYSSPTTTTMYRSLKTKMPFLAREVFYYIGYKWYRIFF